MDGRPHVVLLSRLSIRGETLHRALQEVCAVKWIARRSEFRTDPLRFPVALFREFLRLLATCQLFPEGRRPIVIVHSIGPDAIPAFVVRRIMGCKVTLYAIGPDILGGKKLAQRMFLRWAVRYSDAVLCGNSKIEEKVRSLGGTVTRVLRTPLVPLEPEIERRKDFDVVTVGSLTHPAKQRLLVEASAYLDSSVKIAIVGEGPQKQYLTTLSRMRGSNQVSFLGDLPPKSLYGLLRNSSVYVQCFSDEGPPATVLEAVSCGLTIIALDDDQNPELTELYGLRLIVPKDHSATSLADAIEETILNYPTLLEDVSKNREALESYSKSWPRMAAAAIFS